MRVGWFFPSITLLVAAMIWAAVTPGLRGQRVLEAQLAEVRAVGYVIEGDQLNELRETGGVTFEVIEGGALTRAELKALRPAPKGPPNAGVFFTLPASVAHVLRGKRTRVTITARRAPENGANQFSAAYFVARLASSHWRPFQPTARFMDYSFEWTPPADNRGNASIIGLAPDTSGGLGSLEVLRIRVELLEPDAPV